MRAAGPVEELADPGRLPAQRGPRLAPSRDGRCGEVRPGGQRVQQAGPDGQGGRSPVAERLQCLVPGVDPQLLALPEQMHGTVRQGDQQPLVPGQDPPLGGRVHHEAQPGNRRAGRARPGGAADQPDAPRQVGRLRQAVGGADDSDRRAARGVRERAPADLTHRHPVAGHQSGTGVVQHRVQLSTDVEVAGTGLIDHHEGAGCGPTVVAPGADHAVHGDSQSGQHRQCQPRHGAPDGPPVGGVRRVGFRAQHARGHPAEHEHVRLHLVTTGLHPVPSRLTGRVLGFTGRASCTSSPVSRAVGAARFTGPEGTGPGGPGEPWGGRGP